MDLVSLLDDSGAEAIFTDLWDQFIHGWQGWQSVPPLAYTGPKNRELFIDWDATPFSRDILDQMQISGLDYKTIALIMVEDFLEYMDDYDGLVAFRGLWDMILDHYWTINHQLEYVGF